ncbi:hypothetical protein LZ023_13680 [Pseudomonas silvicola]|nr:hypothetical protein LZ023_13680 [Pseudomonas silvicola]
MKNIPDRSFSAVIDCFTDDQFYGLTHETQGWLVTDANQSGGLMFNFEYIERTENRLHYNISMARGTFEGSRVGISTNSYIGLYKIAAVSAFWKMEPLNSEWEPGQALNFRWRDNLGQVVSMRRYYPLGGYLPDAEGRHHDAQFLCLNHDDAVPLTFRARNITFI